jgi:hypothetical protein
MARRTPAVVDGVGVDEVRMPGEPAAQHLAVHFVQGSVVGIVFDLHELGEAVDPGLLEHVTLQGAEHLAEPHMHFRSVLAAEHQDAAIDPQIEERLAGGWVLEVFEGQAAHQGAERHRLSQGGDLPGLAGDQRLLQRRPPRLSVDDGSARRA